MVWHSRVPFVRLWWLCSGTNEGNLKLVAPAALERKVRGLTIWSETGQNFDKEAQRTSVHIVGHSVHSLMTQMSTFLSHSRSSFFETVKSMSGHQGLALGTLCSFVREYSYSSGKPIPTPHLDGNDDFSALRKKSQPL